MANKRRSYTPEYKREAAKMAAQCSYDEQLAAHASLSPGQPRHA